jgi:hypothetical protein
MSQTELVLKHLRVGKSLTPIDALVEYGCFRLAAIVHILKRDGWNIETFIVKDKINKKRYAKYVMQTPEKL